MAQPTLRSRSCWLYSGQSVPSSQTNQAAQATSAVTAGLGLVHKHCSHSVTGCSSPLSLGEGIFFSLFPGTPLPSRVGVPGAPGSLASWQHGRGLVQPRWESEAYCSQCPLSPSLSWKQKRSEDRYPPCSPDQPAFGLHKHTHFPFRAFAGLPCSSSPSYQRTSVSSRPVPYHS